MEAAFRLAAFAAVFALLALWEVVGHRRALAQARDRRWATNLGLLLIDILVQRITLGAIAFTAAIVARDNGIGLFNRLDWPPWLAWLLAFVALDLAVWLQHVVTHRVPILWRLHQVHHADLDVDLTTGLRFHPVEILLSALWKAAVVLALGADPYVVLAFEAVLNAAALFTHANVAMPGRIDGALRWLVCTPDMHRVHHSVEPRETHSNFGFFLSLWDRAFGTMRGAPRLGHHGVTLGLPQHRDPARLGLARLLALPVERPPRSPAGQVDDA